MSKEYQIDELDKSDYDKNMRKGDWQMKRIEVFLLGTPRVYIEKNLYLFPYGRAEAMFYYLAVKGSENKQVLEDIFWGDKYGQEKANKNYRNALYRIRKDFGREFLIPDGRQKVRIHPQADFHVDIQDMKKDLEILSGKESLCFLDHFEVKESSGFEEFVYGERGKLQEEIYLLVKKELESEERRLGLCEEICKNLISTDEFCEKYYELLMEIYAAMGEKQRAESVYRGLEKLLQRELGTEPGESVKKTAERIRTRKEPETRESQAKDVQSREPEDQRCTELLQWISMFCDRAEYRKLKYFSGYDEDVLVEVIEKLVRNGSICETEMNGKIFYSFAEEEEAKKTYESMSLTRRRRLHGIMAQRFEHQFLVGRNEDILPRIIYHYFRSGNQQNADKYLEEYLCKYMEISHEYFPVNTGYEILHNTETYLNNKKQIKYLLGAMEAYVEESVQSVNPNVYEKERLKLYNTMLAQSYVKVPDYEKAWKYIRRLEELQGITTESAKQKACLYMDTCQGEKLIQVSRQGERLISKETGERGYWKRIRGIGYILEGKMEEGRQELLQAADIFLEKQWRKYWITNAAVAYSWAGEAWRLEGRLENAMEYFRKSLDIHSGVHNISGKTLLYLRMGQGLFDQGKEEQAERYLKAAIQSFEHLEVVFKRSTAYALEAVLLFRKGEHQEGAKYLRRAGIFAERMRDPGERYLYTVIMEEILAAQTVPDEIKEEIRLGKKVFQKAAEAEKIGSRWEKIYLEKFCVF